MSKKKWAIIFFLVIVMATPSVYAITLNKNETAQFNRKKIEQLNTSWGFLAKGEALFVDSVATFLTKEILQSLSDELIEQNIYDEDLMKKMTKDREQLIKSEDLYFLITIKWDDIDKKEKRIPSVNKFIISDDKGDSVPANYYALKDSGQRHKGYSKLLVTFPNRIPGFFRSAQHQFILNDQTKYLKLLWETQESVYMYKFDLKQVQ